MISLPGPRRVSKRLLILAGIVLGVVVACSLAWWLTSLKTTGDFRSQTKQHYAATSQKIAETTTVLKGLHEQQDAKKSIDALVALADTLTKQANTLPQLPRVFGITTVPGEDMQARETAYEYMTKLAQDVRDARDLLEYERLVAGHLQGLSLKTGANAEQQKALADSWAAVVAELKAARPPNMATSVHQQFMASCTAVQASLAALPDLYNKKDVAGFAAKQKEIETHISELRGLGATVANVATAHDKVISHDYQALKRVLGQ